MSFAPALSVPTIARRDLDDVNECFKPLAKELRPFHAKWRERSLIYDLTSAQYIVLCAVVSRTLGWSKLLEVIPLSVFTDGLQKDGALVMMDGFPAFAGTKLDRKTVRTSLAFLNHAGLITRFSYPSGGRETFAYTPLSVWTLRAILAKFPDHGSIHPVIAPALRVSSDGQEMRSDFEALFVAAFTRTPVDLAAWTDAE